MARDLSIINAVQIQACNFTGCANCPFRILPYTSHACINPGGGSDLSGAIDLGKFLGRDTKSIARLINVELEEVETDGEDYQVMSLDQNNQFIRWLDELLAAATETYEAKTYFLHTDHESTAKETISWWLEEGRDASDTIRISISRLIFSLQSVHHFLTLANEKSYEVEVGRYTFGKLQRQLLE